MTKFWCATSELPKVDYHLTKALIQGIGLWQGRSVLFNGGGGEPNGEPSSGHHGGAPSRPWNGHPSRPPNGPPSEHFGNLFVDLVGGRFGKILSGPFVEPFGEPSGGPPMGLYPSGRLLYDGTFPMGTWTWQPWRPWVST